MRNFILWVSESEDRCVMVGCVFAIVILSALLLAS